MTEKKKIFNKSKKKKDKNILIIGIKKDRELIYKNINKRVDLMVRRGLVAEARRIMKKYGKKTPGFLGIGYRQLIPYFKGKSSKDEAIAEIKKDTRRFAKRQFTWYKKDKNIKWVSGFREADKLIKKFISS
jgi:tRNA dimethylallyltransferase